LSGIDELTPEKIKRVLDATEELMRLYKLGLLGGEVMPEDSNPALPESSEENYLFFTLPMALNYQRNSYRLWESAKRTYRDIETVDVFSPAAVVNMDIGVLRYKLLKHKVAVQPNKHPQIWMQLSRTFMLEFGGSVKNFFAANALSVAAIKGYMTTNKKKFPYLSGEKIMNYWLYVMGQYTDAVFIDKGNITVAPDTHVLQASVKLGLIKPNDVESPNIRKVVSEIWATIFAGTDWYPIDIHTPLWLWSRGGFSVEVGEYGGELSQGGVQLLF
jgi:hypothetical protein